jgi:predicted transcriptional regulator
MSESAEIKIRFYPERSHLALFMGELEAELMEIVWAHGPTTVKRALYHLNKKRPAAYTTVMTVMNRLTDKNLLSRTKKGHSFTYSATIERNRFLNLAVREVLAALMNDFPDVANRALSRIRRKRAKSKKSGGDK